jgi:hypothetical protein
MIVMLGTFGNYIRVCSAPGAWLFCGSGRRLKRTSNDVQHVQNLNPLNP